MSEPTPRIPLNAITDARDLLHPVLVEVFEAVGWSGERVSRLPVLTPNTPGAWVDAPTLSREGVGLVATFPLGVAIDGTAASQVERLDGLLAMLWAALEGTRIPEGSRLPAGGHPRVVAAGPAPFEIGGGPTVRAVALTVEVDIALATLCPTPMTGDLTP